MTTYTSSQIASLLGISTRKLITFVERGYVTPSIQDADGHSSTRLWSFHDVVRCVVIAFLMSSLSVNYLRKLAPHLAKNQNIAPGSVWYLDLQPGARMEVSQPEGRDIAIAESVPDFSQSDISLSIARKRDDKSKPGTTYESEPRVILKPNVRHVGVENITHRSAAMIVLNFEQFHDYVNTKLV